MPSSSGAEETLTLPADTNAPVEAMDAKLMVATGSGDVQQLKDLVKKEDSKMMVVVMAKQSASAEKPRHGNMDPHLLALASSGNCEELRSLLRREDRQACADGSSTVPRASEESTLEGVTSEGDNSLLCASSSERPQTLLSGEDGQARSNNGSIGGQGSDDIEANESILKGVTAEGDTALHVVATCGQGDNFFTWSGDAKHLLVQMQNNNNRRWRPTRAERYALKTYGDGDNFLESARIIHGEATRLLFEPNKNGDTPLHCAAGAGKSNMVACLIDLAQQEGDENKVKELLRKENNQKETALHQAVRIGNKGIVDLLMEKDSELAGFPEDGGASPLYLAIVLKRDSIVDTLFNKGHGKLSFSGQNGQNALHAAVLRDRGVTKKLLELNKRHLCQQNKDLTAKMDENGSTPLHFAAAIRVLFFGPSRNCRQVLEANADALYQPDHAGLFPIHVAASVGSFRNVGLFLNKCPGSASLRDAKGRTFLHVAVEKKMVNVVSFACRDLSLSWIMNMRDDDGNTALHLAVETGSLQLCCPLMGNPQVNVNLPNNKGETPLDIAEAKLPDGGFYHNQSSEAQIRSTLILHCGAVNGVHRKDHLEDNKTRKFKQDGRKESEVLKDSAGTLCIGSVLIASVTFGATFAVPGGYIADDHNNGGTPVFARRYAFDAFIPANTLAFVCSAVATIGLMYSGSPLYNRRSRMVHLGIAFYLLSISVTSLIAAFALGAYVVLAPVAHKTAVATCVLSSLGLLYNHLEFIGRHLLLLPLLCQRKGRIRGSVHSAAIIIVTTLLEYWPLIFIFGWAAHASTPKTESVAQAPAPSA
ncbi:unnamed protein product [Urochloa decumbens]|uniref:Tyrosine specific protein phosphatases domain-containing protein n=1 Tax=Urochloa decumbens TaxID=240449 RepID=A0ABC9AKM4_9POAL